MQREASPTPALDMATSKALRLGFADPISLLVKTKSNASAIPKFVKI